MTFWIPTPQEEHRPNIEGTRTRERLNRNEIQKTLFLTRKGLSPYNSYNLNHINYLELTYPFKLPDSHDQLSTDEIEL